MVGTAVCVARHVGGPPHLGGGLFRHAGVARSADAPLDVGDAREWAGTRVYRDPHAAD